MTDENPNKASLEGRGREIMRGPQEEDTSPESKSGSWLPSVSDDEAETPFFEDENALLRWMEADPEAHRPTALPNQNLVKDKPIDTGILYPDPDFDAIFDEEEPTPPPPAGKTETQTLDDIFAEEAPNFDDIFGDIAASTVPDTATQELPVLDMPLPETGELYYEDDIFAESPPAEASPTPLDDLHPGTSPDFPPDKVTTGHIPILALDANDEDQEHPPISALADAGLTAEEFDESDVFAGDMGRSAAPSETSYRMDSEEDLEPAFAQDELPQDAPLPDTSQLDSVPGRDSGLLEMQDWDNPRFATEDDDDLFGDSADLLEMPPARSDMEPELEPSFFLDELDLGEDAPLAEAPYEPDATLEAVPLGNVPPLGAQADAPIDMDEFLPFADDEETLFLETADARTLELMAEMPEQVEEVEPVDPYAQYMEMPGEQLGEATAILNEKFEDDESLERTSADNRALELLNQMTADDIEEVYEEEEWQTVDEPRFTDAAAFVEHIQAESAVDPMLEPLIAPTPEEFGSETRRQEATTPLYADEEEALPPAEASTPVVDLRTASIKRSGIDKLTPEEPETLGGVLFELEPETFADDLEDVGGSDEDPVLTRSAFPPIITGAASASGQSAELFAPPAVRENAEQFLKIRETTTDRDLLELFVDDNRLRELFEQIEALQEEIVQNVRGERGYTDQYQKELLEASNLMMQSRENYDEARAIVYRVRADLNRERRVDADIAKYRPILTNVYVGLLIFLVVLFLLGQLFITLADSVGVPWLGQGYYPALFGAVGAWLSGIFAIYRHTIVRRDFDPNHVNWYIINPLIGLVAGFLVYLVLLAPNVTSLSINSEVIGSSPITWFIAAGVGYNQNTLLELLNTARDRVSSSSNLREGN